MRLIGNDTFSHQLDIESNYYRDNYFILDRCSPESCAWSPEVTDKYLSYKCIPKALVL